MHSHSNELRGYYMKDLTSADSVIGTFVYSNN